MAETQQKAKYAKLQVRSYNQSNSEEKTKTTPSINRYHHLMLASKRIKHITRILEKDKLCEQRDDEKHTQEASKYIIRR